MEGSEVFSIVIAAIQVLVTIALAAAGMVPWGMRVLERITKLELRITNGLTCDVKQLKDDVRHIRENCPGCEYKFRELEQKVKELDKD